MQSIRALKQQCEAPILGTFVVGGGGRWSSPERGKRPRLRQPGPIWGQLFQNSSCRRMVILQIGSLRPDRRPSPRFRALAMVPLGFPRVTTRHSNYQLASASNAQLLKYSVKVCFDSTFAEPQLISDYLVSQPGGYEQHNLLLA
jgi:hypothetical protein